MQWSRTPAENAGDDEWTQYADSSFVGRTLVVGVISVVWDVLLDIPYTHIFTSIICIMAALRYFRWCVPSWAFYTSIAVCVMIWMLL